MYRPCLIKFACVVSCLTRCQSEDYIGGFEDLGSQSRASNIANHDLAFILCVYVKSGSKRRLSIWFTEGLIVRRLLFSWRRFLMPAVVATMFDMADNNLRHCNSWVFLKRQLFFRFRNEDMAAGFDPPHPLKCTRNHFLKHDVRKCLAWCCNLTAT
jgi:hypothetical protein